MTKYFKKADIILFFIILALSAAGFILLRSNADASSKVEVSVSGKVTETHPLMTDGTYTIKTDYGYNIIEVKKGQVRISDADCPNKDCMHFGKITKEGQVILCLPHELSVRITGGSQGGSDAVSW